MDCLETRTLLNAFHDGELPPPDRARVEEHLRGCTECGALLADLARADQAAGVPDPGPEYWDRFNARVMDRVARGADGPGVRVLRPKGGWMREQLRYLVPAAAAAALVLVIVHYGGMRPGAPTPMARDGQVPGQAGMPRVLESRPTARDGQVPGQAGMPRVLESRPTARDGQVPGQAGMPRVLESRPTAKNSGGAAPARRLPPPVLTEERSATGTREGLDRMADRSIPTGSEEAKRGREAAAPAAGALSPPQVTFRGEPAGSPPAAAADGTPRGLQAERKKVTGLPEVTTARQGSGKSASASEARMGKEPSVQGPPSMSLGKTVPAPSRVASPCGLARSLAERERARDAEAAQRACLAGDLDAPSREKGLVFLAELLDRQARFTEADAVIAEVEKQYPQSRPLDLYLRERPMVQKDPTSVPVTR